MQSGGGRDGSDARLDVHKFFGPSPRVHQGFGAEATRGARLLLSLNGEGLIDHQAVMIEEIAERAPESGLLLGAKGQSGEDCTRD